MRGIWLDLTGWKGALGLCGWLGLSWTLVWMVRM